MDKWEYTKQHHEAEDGQTFIEWLNVWGNMGWEVAHIQILLANSATLVVFKRLKEEPCK